MKQRARIMATLLMYLALVIGMFPLLQVDAFAASDTITGAPKNLKVSRPAAGEKSVTISWTPNLDSGIDRNSSLIIEASSDNKKTWEAVDVISFEYGSADINNNSYAKKSSSYVDLEFGKTYYFRAYYIDSVLQEGPVSNIAGPITCKKAAESSSGSSGSSSSGSSGGSSTSGSGKSGSGSSGSTTTFKKPKLSDVYVSIRSITPGKMNLYATQYVYDYSYNYGLQVKYDGKKVWDTAVDTSSREKNITIPYGKKVTFKYRVYKYPRDGKKKNSKYSKWKSVTKKSIVLNKPTLEVTRISSKKAGLVWSRIEGATGYKIFRNGKLVKTIKKGKTTNLIYSKSGAGSGKYCVQPLIKNNKMKKAATGRKSKVKKGKANERTYSYRTDLSGMKYGVAPYDISKISLSGNTYTVTGYVLNNRLFRLQKYQKLKIILYCDGKKVATKTFRNLKVNVKDYGVKKLTVKISGKGGVDFRNSAGITYHAEWVPYWQTVGTSTFD